MDERTCGPRSRCRHPCLDELQSRRVISVSVDTTCIYPATRPWWIPRVCGDLTRPHLQVARGGQPVVRGHCHESYLTLSAGGVEQITFSAPSARPCRAHIPLRPWYGDVASGRLALIHARAEVDFMQGTKTCMQTDAGSRRPNVTAQIDRLSRDPAPKSKRNCEEQGAWLQNSSSEQTSSTPAPGA